MIISFILIPILIISFYLSLKGLGFFFSKILFGDEFDINPSIYALFSLPIIFFLVTTIHLFTRLNPVINLIIILFGLLVYFLKVKKSENIIFYSIIIFILSIQFYGHNVNEDYGYYHLPYIINFISDKIIIGLYHLSMVQGYNSAWLNTSAFFYLPFFNDKTIHFANSVLFFSLLIFYFGYLFNKKNLLNFPISTLYSLLALTFFITKNSRLNSFGVDVPGHIYASVVLFLFINFFENKDFLNKKKIFYLLSIFSIFCIFIKLSYAPFILFPIICLFYEKYVLDKKIFTIILIFGFSWVVQQISYTSCVVFPVEFTCFKSLSWYSKNFIADAAFGLEIINKSHWQYEGNLSDNEYIKNFNWLNTWFKRNFIELLENIMTYLFPCILLLIYSLKKKSKIVDFNRSNIIKILLLISIPISLGFLIWFTKAPVVRYGIFYINSLIFIIFLFIFHNVVFNNFDRKFIISILLISVSFNLLKNLNRIIKIEDYNDYPFPKITKIIYETKKVEEFNLNSPIPQGNIESTVCWNTPVYCMAGKFDGINLKRVNNYTIINQN